MFTNSSEMNQYQLTARRTPVETDVSSMLLNIVTLYLSGYDPGTEAI